MIQKLVISLCIIFYTLCISASLLNNFLLFNTAWIDYIHVGQFLAATFVFLLCLKLVWIDREIIKGVILSMILPFGFLISSALQVNSASFSSNVVNVNPQIEIMLIIVGVSLFVGLLGITMFIVINKLISLKLESVAFPSAWFEGLI